MTFKELLDIFKNISSFDELIFVYKIIQRNQLDLVNKNSGYVNGYDFDSLTNEECLAMKYGCGISRKIKYKNICKNFKIENPNQKENLDIEYIEIPKSLAHRFKNINKIELSSKIL